MKDKMNKWVEKARTAIKWVAVDADGCIYGYNKKPCSGELCWAASAYIFLGETLDAELIKNWEKSLRKVEYGK